jgi:hypothetical protein
LDFLPPFIGLVPLRLFGRAVVLSDGGLYTVLGDVEAFVIVFVRVFVIEGNLIVLDALPVDFVPVSLFNAIDGKLIIYYVNI